MKHLKNLFTGSAMLAISACVAPPDQYGSNQGRVYMDEGPNYNTQRGRLVGVEGQCNVRTSERGRVIGGTAVFETGNATRTCNFGPAANNRYNRYDSPLEQATDGLREVERTIYTVRRIERILDW